MFGFFTSYWNKPSMRRSPVSAHPLSLSDDDRSTASPRTSAELPKKETMDGSEKQVEPPAVQEMTTYRTREHSRGRRGTPTPTLTLAKTASEVVVKPVEQPQPQPIMQAPIAVRPRGYSTASRRSTPTPAFTPTSTSASTPTSTTPIPRLPSPHGHLKRSDSNRHFDLTERRAEPNPFRKRRNTDDDHLRTTIAEKEKENTSLSQQLYSTRNDLAEAIKKNGGFQRRIQDLLGEKSKVLTQQQAAQKEAAEKEHAAARKIAELEAAHRRKDDELRTAQARLHAAEEKQVTLSKLLEVRTADLNGVQTFLTTADTYSGAEIIAMVETLNAEIFQTAAYMAELIEDESMAASAQERSKNVERNRQAMETQLRRDLGEDLWQYFQKKYTELRVEPLPLQLAFQCILSRWSVYKIRTFLIGHFGENLGKVYQMIRESEAQAVAGRWRALTNAKLSAFKDDYPANVVVDILINMLFLCGWSTSSEKSKKAVLLMQQMVFNIGKMASQIKTATKEGITTADLDVFMVNAGSALRDGMEDVYADSSSGDARVSETNKRVLCTVGIGLRRTIVKHTEGRSPDYKDEILLKPKVALASVLESAGLQGEN